MSIPRVLYLLLAVVGVGMTWYHNLQFMQESGGMFDLGAFLAATSGNAASRSLSNRLHCSAASITGHSPAVPCSNSVHLFSKVASLRSSESADKAASRAMLEMREGMLKHRSRLGKSHCRVTRVC